MVNSGNNNKRTFQTKSRSEDLLIEIDKYFESKQMKRSICSISSLKQIRERIKELEKELNLMKRNS